MADWRSVAEAKRDVAARKRQNAGVGRPPTRTGAMIVVALALGTMSGCRGDSPKSAPKAHSRNSAVARCAGAECRVRIVCNGRVYVRLGAAPVRIHTARSAFRTTIIADFAGSRDAVVRC
jgi:hypothetical protein